MKGRLFLRPQLKHALVWVLATLFVTALSTGLNFFLTVPHEFGHYLSCSIFRARVEEVQWLGMEGGYVRYQLPCWLPYESQAKTIIRFSGGLFAGFVVFLAYMIFSRLCKFDADLRSRSDIVIVVVRIVLMISLVKQLISGVLEGILPNLYKLTFHALPYFAIMIILATFSIKIHKIMIQKSKLSV